MAAFDASPSASRRLRAKGFESLQWHQTRSHPVVEKERHPMGLSRERLAACNFGDRPPSSRPDSPYLWLQRPYQLQLAPALGIRHRFRLTPRCLASLLRGTRIRPAAYGQAVFRVASAGSYMLIRILRETTSDHNGEAHRYGFAAEVLFASRRVLTTSASPITVPARLRHPMSTEMTILAVAVPVDDEMLLVADLHSSPSRSTREDARSAARTLNELPDYKSRQEQV